ncbi:MAG TPA: hypothetical protein VNU71_03640 [Burkholderiaceae bacterium]|nr:hypothetical protein [Burkholderiaceae bacterium]
MLLRSDLAGIGRSGALARRRGEDYFSNPHLFERRPLEEWHAIASAWSAGWIEEDDGRDERIARLLNMRFR